MIWTDALDLHLLNAMRNLKPFGPSKSSNMKTIAQVFFKSSHVHVAIPDLLKRIGELFDLDALEKIDAARIALAQADDPMDAEAAEAKLVAAKEVEAVKEEPTVAPSPPPPPKKSRKSAAAAVPPVEVDKEEPMDVDSVVSTPTEPTAPKKRTTTRKRKDSSANSTPNILSPVDQTSSAPLSAGVPDIDTKLMPPPAPTARGARTGRRSAVSSREASPVTSPRGKRLKDGKEDVVSPELKEDTSSLKTPAGGAAERKTRTARSKGSTASKDSKEKEKEAPVETPVRRGKRK